MKRRLTFLLTAVLTALPLLTGCGAKQQSSSVPDTSSVSETNAETTETAASAPVVITDPFQYEAGTPEVTDNREGVKNVCFYRDGIRIRGQLFVPKGKGPFPTVVLCSGMTASFTYYSDEAATFAQNGYAAIVFDFIGAVSGRVPGTGSGGELTDYSVLTEAKDLNVILDSLSALPKVDSEKVFLFGHSLGGTVATYVGCRRPEDIQGMMLVEPSYQFPDQLRNLADQKVGGDLSLLPDTITDLGSVVGRIFFTDMYGLDIYRYMPDCSRDVLIFLGTQNALGAEYRSYFERAKECFPSAEVMDIEGADHNFQGEYGVKMVEQCLVFLRNHVSAEA